MRAHKTSEATQGPTFAIVVEAKLIAAVIGTFPWPIADLGDEFFKLLQIIFGFPPCAAMLILAVEISIARIDGLARGALSFPCGHIRLSWHIFLGRKRRAALADLHVLNLNWWADRVACLIRGNPIELGDVIWIICLHKIALVAHHAPFWASRDLKINDDQGVVAKGKDVLPTALNRITHFLARGVIALQGLADFPNIADLPRGAGNVSMFTRRDARVGHLKRHRRA